MKMKKPCISALLSLFIMACLYVPSAFAENIYIVKNKDVPDAGGVYIKTEQALYGKDEGSAKLMEGMALSNKVICFANSKEIYNHSYIVFEASFAPLDGLDSISLQTANAKNVSYYLRKGWKNNRWNSIRIVCSKADENSRFGYATFYINGTAEIINSPLTAEFAENMRISFNGVPAKERLRLYIDSYSIYFSDRDHGAQALPTADSEGIRTLFSRLYITKESLNCGDISFSNAETAVYTDDSFKTKKESSAPAEIGNIAVVKTKDGEIYYYEITRAESKNTLNAAAKPLYKNCRAEYENGRLRVENIDNKSEAEVSFKVPASDRYDILELTADIYPQDISGVCVMSNKGKSISPRIYTLNGGIEKNEWSSIRVLYERENLKASVYLNDVRISEKSDVLLAEDTECEDLKLVLFGKSGSAAYIDNYAVNYILKTDEDTKSIVSGDPQEKNAGGGCTAAAEKAIFGKAAEDTSLYLSLTNKDLYRFFYKVTPEEEYTKYKYLVYELNIAPVEGAAAFYLQTENSARVSKAVTEGFKEKEWNSFKFVYEMPQALYQNGRTTCYLNGEAVFKDEENIAPFAGTNVRIAIDSTKTQDISLRRDLSVYIDDVNVYLTNIKPEAQEMPCLKEGRFKINGGILTVDDSFSLKNIAAENAEVRCFREGVLLSADETIKSGDKIVLETEKKIYKTYTAEVAVPECIDDIAENAAAVQANKELVTYFAGKTQKDKLYRVTANSDAGNINYDWKNTDVYSGYLIIEGNAYIESGKFSVGLRNTAALEFDTSGEWVHFQVIADKSLKENNVFSYINGAFAGSCTKTDFYGAEANIRFKISGKAGDSVILDDLRLYAQRSAPNITEPPTTDVNSLILEKYINGYGKTAQEFGTENITAAAFDTKDLKNAAENKGGLNTGDYLLIYDSEKRAYNGYTVAKLKQDNNKILFEYPKNCAVIIAEYGKNAMFGAAAGKAAGGITAAEYTASDENSRIAIFTLNSFSDIKPIEKPVYVR